MPPLASAFERQIGWCRQPSPFTARLLERLWRWLQLAPDARAASEAVAGDPLAAAVPLRWAGALHHLALRRLEPWAGTWPPHRATDLQLDAAIAHAWATQRDALVDALSRPPQTNEVQRSCALLPGLLHVAAATGRPLALLEIGASAGINLWPERHGYDYGSWRWGDDRAPLQLKADWQGAHPPDVRLEITRRAACDRHPVDITQPAEALRLESFVWPDQIARMERLRQARDGAARWLAAEGVAVQPVAAGEFVARELARADPGVTTVLMHSIVWQYIAADEQQAVQAALQAAAARGLSLAWLRFEPPEPERRPELRCTLWPGGQDRLLALAHAHVGGIEWCA